MSTDTIVIHLPDGLHRRLERLADLTQRPLENVIVQALSSSLPLLPDDLPATTRDALIALEPWSDDRLRDLTEATLPDDQYAQLTALREKRREGALSKDEQVTLERLTQEADLLTLKKAYAAVLLKWRGHQLPIRSESDS